MVVRGISSVVDATVFLLLVGGAVATLVAGTGGVETDQRNPAAEGARVLTTATATVNYSLAPAARHADGGVDFHRTNGTDFRRSSHGTLASLVADAAVGNATVDGRRLSYRTLDFERAVTEVVRSRTDRARSEIGVTAVWEPYPGAPVSGTVRAGPGPPRDADVRAASVAVDSDAPAVGDAAERAAAEAGYAGVARVAAEGVVRGLFPPNETRLALRGHYPVDALTAHRYRRAATLFDAPRPGVGRTPVEEMNDGLASALADRFERDMRARYESPEAAAADLDVGSVRVTVRTWSP